MLVTMASETCLHTSAPGLLTEWILERSGFGDDLFRFSKFWEFWGFP
jgi:hypothetical protein